MWRLFNRLSLAIEGFLKFRLKIEIGVRFFCWERLLANHPWSAYCLKMDFSMSDRRFLKLWILAKPSFSKACFKIIGVQKDLWHTVCAFWNPKGAVSVNHRRRNSFSLFAIANALKLAHFHSVYKTSSFESLVESGNVRVHSKHPQISMS